MVEGAVAVARKAWRAHRDECVPCDRDGGADPFDPARCDAGRALYAAYEAAHDASAPCELCYANGWRLRDGALVYEGSRDPAPTRAQDRECVPPCDPINR